MSGVKSLHENNDPTQTVVSGSSSSASSAAASSESDPTKTVVSPAPMTGRHLELEAEILDELRRMNRLLYGITYGPRRYTLLTPDHAATLVVEYGDHGRADQLPPAFRRAGAESPPLAPTTGESLS